VNGAETVPEIPVTDVALSEPLAAAAESLSALIEPGRAPGRSQHRGTSALAGYLGYTSYPHRTLS
jgi:hypothetical protein